MALEHCFSSLRAERIRVAKLTSTGAPNPGASNGYVSDAQIKVDFSPEISRGDALEQKNGGGRICASVKDADRLKWINLGMELCQLDAQLMEFLTSGPTFENGSVIIGGQAPSVTADLDTWVCFEVWTMAWDDTEQAIPTFTSPDGAYFHWVFPKTRWVIGSTTLDNGIHVFPVDGESQENSNITINGPFNDWPAAVADEGGVTRCYGYFLDGDIPDAACGPVAVSAS